jgi:hypothetical protein
VIWSRVLASRLRLARNILWPPAGRSGKRGRWQPLLAIVFSLSFFVLAFTAMAATLAHLESLGLGLDHARLAMATMLTGALVGILVFDVHYAVSALLLDSDLELLRRAPLRAGSLLLIKLLDSLPRTAALVVGIALPACLAFALVHGVPTWFWALLPAVLAGLWATPLGLGVAAAILLVRVVPAQRAREVLAIFSTLVLVALWMINSFVAPRLLEEEGEIARRLSSLAPAPWVAALSPPHWAADALLAAHRGAALEAMAWTTRLLVAGAVSLAAAYLAARVLLDRALAQLSAGGAAKGRPRPRRASIPASGFRALLLKDARLFVRDWTVLGDVLSAAALWTLLPLVGGPLHQAEPHLLARFMLVALAVGLGYEVGTRLIPYEGAGLAWCRLAPLSAWRWNLAKILAAAFLTAPLLALAAIMIRAVTPLTFGQWSEAVATGIGALLLSLSLGLWTGWTFGDPHWTQPRAMLTLTGRLLAASLLIVQAGLWLGLLAVADSMRGELPEGLHAWGPLVLGGMLTLPLLALAARAARRLEWTA